MIKARSIIPRVRRRRPIDWDAFAAISVGLTGGLLSQRPPEAIRRQIEINNRIQAEAYALWETEQKHPKKLVHDSPSPEE